MSVLKTTCPPATLFGGTSTHDWGPYLEGQGGLVSRLITPTTLLVTLSGPFTNLY